MDADISAAKDSLELAKIRAQDQRNHQAACLAVEKDRLAFMRAESTKIDAETVKLDAPQTDAERRFDIALAIAEKYMTTSTATVLASVQLDAQNDAARLKAAIDEVMKVV